MTVAEVIRAFYMDEYNDGAEIEVLDTDGGLSFGFGLESAEEIFEDRQVAEHEYRDYDKRNTGDAGTIYMVLKGE